MAIPRSGSNTSHESLTGGAASAVTVLVLSGVLLLQAAKRNKPAKGINNFCVIGQLAKDQGKSAWIIWRQKREIILWEGQDLVTARPRRVIDLDKDVVASESELHGSSYLVTRQWVRSLVSECKKTGLQTVVGPDG